MGDFVDFTELPPAKGKLHPLTAPEGSVILIQSYNMCCVLYSQDPSHLPSMVSYMYRFNRVSQHYMWPSWVIFESNFQQEAAEKGKKDWRNLDQSMYAGCSNGQGKNPNAWCPNCHSLDHYADQCPLQSPTSKRPKHGVMDWGPSIEL